MNKILLSIHLNHNKSLPQLARIMKLVFILIFICSMHVSAKVYSQERFTLNMSNVSVDKVFNKIQKESNYRFFYNYGYLKHLDKINLVAKNETLSDILNKLLDNTLAYQILDGNLVVISLKGSQQAQHRIEGKVTDEKGTALSGVSVQIKGTSQGAITDAAGKFALVVPDDAVLSVSFVGYETQEITVGNKTNINIQLKVSVSGLNEVVVIGYGTVRRKDLTGAITSVKGSDIKSEGISSLTRALQGKMPGVEIESAGGDPGAGTRILIRGVGTLGNSSPLYIVDGVQVSNINNIPGADIESIDVLKDASAAAIYGSRAANGVVLVTTKIGKSGKPLIQFNANYGWQKVAKKLDLLDAQQWATVSNTAHDAAGLPRLAIAQNPDSLGKGTDWQDAIFRTAPTQQYELLVSGGNESSRYSISGSYNDQDGIVKTTGYNRYNLRVKTETTKGRFKFGETVLLSREKWITMPNGWGGQGGNPVGSAALMIPVFKIYDSTALGGYAGAYGPVVNIANPIAQLNLEKINRELTSILANAYGELTILPGLKYRLNLGYTNAFGTNSDYAKRYVVGTLFAHNTNDLSQSKDQNVNVLLENTLNYDKQFGKNSVQALAGYTYQQNKYSYLSASRTDLPDGIVNIDAGAGVSNNGGNSSQNDLLSVLGRVIYSYDNRYLLTASFRRDGSSRFGNANRYGNFPSIALGWNLSNEKFFEPLSDKISALKIRASYGELGNQEIGDYQYSAAIASNINYVIGEDQHKWFGAIQTALSSPDIKWENTKTSNVGLDLGVFNNKLTVTADYFVKTTTDVLLQVPIAPSVGSTSSPYVNAGTLRNNGVEIGANYAGQAGKLKFNVFGTFTAVKNKVVQLGTGTQQIFGGQPTHHGASTTLTEAGGPIGGFYLIKDLGIFNSQEEVDNYKNKSGGLIQPNAAPGDIKFQDTNGDGQISDLDKVYLGSPFPKFEYGFGLNASIYNFDLNMFFQGTYGNKIYNGFREDFESMSLEFNYSTATLNAWTPTNHSNIPRAVINDPNFNDRVSSRFLEDGSYLRMKTLQIGYTFQDNFKNRLKLSSLRAYISADNIFTITKYSGYNPDLGRTGSILDRGVDFGHPAYPLAKTVSLGIQLSL
jgi:TonB-dependent starch-binding outer membrane protein SusC